MFKGKVLLFSLLLVFATSLHAGDVDPCESDFGISCTEMRVSICPAGDFENIYDGCGTGSDYIWLYARDGSGDGIEDVPWTDYWLSACTPPEELVLCAAPFGADALTNAEGYTEISRSIAGGGCILTGGVSLSIQGKAIVDSPGCVAVTCHQIEIISPDLIADLIVNLSDFGKFGDAYGTTPVDLDWNSCCDFVQDDIINLSDFGFFGDHYGHVCF